MHNRVGTYVETANETKRFLDETDPAKVPWSLHVGHLKYGGGDALDFLPAYGDSDPPVVATWRPGRDGSVVLRESEV